MSTEKHIHKLQEIYHEMDTEGRQKILAAAAKLLDTQKVLENIPLIIQNDTQTTTQKEDAEIKITKKSGFVHFTDNAAYLIIWSLLFFAACIFWVTLINPALLKLGETPLEMLRIITTAFCGIFFIGLSLLFFIQQKLTIPLLFFAIGAGILCVEPKALTDFVGIIFALSIGCTQIVEREQKKTTVIV